MAPALKRAARGGEDLQSGFVLGLLDGADPEKLLALPPEEFFAAFTAATLAGGQRSPRPQRTHRSPEGPIMAMDMFIKIGELKGESRDKVHNDEIDVLAWSWGISNSGSAQVGGGAG